MVKAILAFVFLIWVCVTGSLAQTPKPCDLANGYLIDKEKPSIYIEFAQFGKADDWKQSRLGEISQKPVIKKGNDVWLRLYNNSCWEIRLTTLSMYVTKIADPANPGKFKMVFGQIQDGNVANVVYTSEEQDGKFVPWAGDSFSTSSIASGHSLLFPVYREHLEKSRSIYVKFHYGWEIKDFSNNLAPDHHAFFWGYRLEEEKKK